MAKQPQEREPAKFTFKIMNFDLSKHCGNERRRLHGMEAQNLYASTASPVGQQHQRANESMEMFARSIGSVTANAISCGRYRQKKSAKLADHPIAAIERLKYCPEYTSTITSIGFNPFFVHYASPEQYALFNEYKKRNTRTKICCDATGNVQKIGKLLCFNLYV